MDELIEALFIFRQYIDDYYPTWCVDDTFCVNCGIDVIKDIDKERLEMLGFYYIEDEGWISYRFGSC